MWETIRIVGVCAVCVSPFWFLAGDLTDGDEFWKTGTGAAMCGIVLALVRYAQSHVRKTPEEAE